MQAKVIKFIISCLICLSAGAIGSFVTFDAIPNWYAFVNKPSFNPPNWIFGPVWTTLYILMGIALFRVWQKNWTHDKKIKNPSKRKAITIFGIQLLLNTIWSFLFFGLKSPMLAFIEIIIMWIFIAWTIKEFYKHDKLASFLLVPYIAWVSFASILNFYIWQLNKF